MSFRLRKGTPMKPTAKRGLMGERFDVQNGAKSLVHIDKKARAERKRPTPKDKREWRDDSNGC